MAKQQTQDFGLSTEKETPKKKVEARTKQEKKAKSGYPVSVYLDEETRAYIDQIIEWTENTPKVRPQSRHAVIQYAVRKLCREWEQGIHPDINILGDFK